MKFELNVVRYDVSDIVTTSGEVGCTVNRPVAQGGDLGKQPDCGDQVI